MKTGEFLNRYCVYFIWPTPHEASDPVKIGRTKFRRLQQRLGDLQDGCWRPLEVAGFILVADLSESKFLESHFHAKFHESRLYREWFTSNPEIERLVEQAAREAVEESWFLRVNGTRYNESALPAEIDAGVVEYCCRASGVEWIDAGHPHGPYIVEGGQLKQRCVITREWEIVDWQVIADWINNPSITERKKKTLCRKFGVL